MSEDTAPVFDERPPIKPTGLSEVASKKWDELLPLLWNAGVIDGGSGEALGLMCETYANYIFFNKKVLKHPTSLGRNKQKILNPLERMRDKFFKDYNRYLDNFGMNPRTRNKIVAHPPKNKLPLVAQPSIDAGNNAPAPSKPEEKVPEKKDEDFENFIKEQVTKEKTEDAEQN